MEYTRMNAIARPTDSWQLHARFDGPIVMIGFGSIGKGTLPLIEHHEPDPRDDWARLMRRAGVKGIHIAERDTQRARDPKPRGSFVNTWSVEGFVAEGLQPSELGWGTHEKALPTGGRHHD